MSSFVDLAKKLNDKAKELDARLCKLKEINDVLVENTDTVLQALESFCGTVMPADPKTCNCCYSRPRTHCFVPCGHGNFCKHCCQRGVARNRCFTCRAEVESILRVYV